MEPAGIGWGMRLKNFAAAAHAGCKAFCVVYSHVCVGGFCVVSNRFSVWAQQQHRQIAKELFVFVLASTLSCLLAASSKRH